MCSYNDFKQAPTMAMNSNSQFHAGNWLGGSSAYYPNAHSYYHPSAMQQHQMLSIMQENTPNTDPNLIPWQHNYQHQNLDWMPPFSGSHQCHLSEYSAEDSPSPASNRTTSPSYNMQTRTKSPYDWIKRTSFQSSEQPSPAGKTRTKDKYRVVYTDQQRVELEKEFLYNKYITIKRKTEMAQGLGLSERQVKIWFQNRRAKERKQAKKKQELQCRSETLLPDRFDHISLRPDLNHNKPEPVFNHL